MIQLAIFKLNNDTLYGIDVKNIIAFIVKEDANINFTPSTTPIIEGIATIRGEPSPIINLDKWINEDNFNRTDLFHKLIIQSNISNKVVSLLVQDVVGIYDIEDNSISKLESNNKVSFVCYAMVDNKKELCVVLNYDNMLKGLNLLSNKLEEVKENIENS